MYSTLTPKPRGHPGNTFRRCRHTDPTTGQECGEPISCSQWHHRQPNGRIEFCRRHLNQHRTITKTKATPTRYISFAYSHRGRKPN